MPSDPITPPSSIPLLSVQKIGPSTRSYTLRAPDRRYGLVDAFMIALSSTIFALTTWPSIFSLVNLIILSYWTYSKLSQVHSETVLVLGTLGVQLSQTTLLGTRHEFVPAFHIQQVIIHEAIDCWNVEFYLAIVIDRGKTGDMVEMEVRRIFRALRPRLEYILPVWRGIREVMFDGNGI